MLKTQITIRCEMVGCENADLLSYDFGITKY